MESNNPLVSVIIPIYKVEPYLRECVDSVINQTYKNLEIILVDDGSPDNCPKICNEYALQDSRIKVIHKENGGLSDARNAGMKIATANYWSFVDSDDVCHPQMIELLMRPLMQNKTMKMSACTRAKVPEHWIVDFTYNVECTVDNISALKFIQFPGWPTAWAKIYLKDLFNGIEYPKGRLHEDEFTTYKLIYYAKDVAYLNFPLYFYRQRNDSIMGQPSVKRMTDVFTALWERMDFFENEGATDFLSVSVKMFFGNMLSNQKTIETRLQYAVEKCKYSDLSFLFRVKMKLKTWFPFLHRIKYK